MALQRLVIDGYGQLELNHAVFPRDGQIEAQCRLSAADFTDAPAENGMILAVDNINREVKLPTAGSVLPLAIVYSTEHMYDERTPGLKNFANFIDGFLPRLGYLKLGDKFTTNTIAYDDGEFADDAALIAALDAIKTTPLYGTQCANGAIKVSATAPESGAQLLVTKKTTMPDGQLGIKFQSIV